MTKKQAKDIKMKIRRMNLGFKPKVRKTKSDFTSNEYEVIVGNDVFRWEHEFWKWRRSWVNPNIGRSRR